jgi:hypothetical protein
LDLMQLLPLLTHLDGGRVRHLSPPVTPEMLVSHFIIAEDIPAPRSMGWMVESRYLNKLLSSLPTPRSAPPILDVREAYGG